VSVVFFLLILLFSFCSVLVVYAFPFELLLHYWFCLLLFCVAVLLLMLFCVAVVSLMFFDVSVRSLLFFGSCFFVDVAPSLIVFSMMLLRR
jgi:hypothetical protein